MPEEATRKLFMGVDIGSASTAAVVIDEEGGVLAERIIDTLPSHQASAAQIAELIYADLSRLLDRAVNGTDIDFCVGTGYGRNSVEYAGHLMTEIACHARGVGHCLPKAKTVIDIGGQDSKVIRLDPSGGAADFAINEKCAAGTGRFLELISDMLETDISQLGPLSLQAAEEARISSMCVVFAETEVISKIAEGTPKEDILLGVHSAIADRVLSLGRRIGVSPPIAFTGGVAKNIGIVHALVRKTGFPKEDVLVLPEPQSVGALGAALYAQAFHAGGRPGVQPSREPATKMTPAVYAAAPTPPRGRRPPVIGWTDLSVPVELITAAGLLNTRLRGRTTCRDDSSHTYMRTYSCEYVKNVASCLMEDGQGGADLDGIITTNRCAATENLFDVLSYDPRFKDWFVHSLAVPRRDNQSGIQYLRNNIFKLKSELEGRYGLEITQQRLRESCRRYNRVKRLLKDYSRLSAEKNVPHAARAFARQMEMLWDTMTVAEDYADDLEQRIRELAGSDALAKRGPNVLLAGSVIPDTGFHDLFDGMRCQVVYDMTSSGNKFSESTVDLDEEDVYAALAKRCLFSGYHPRMTDSRARLDHLRNVVDTYKIEAVIYNVTKFCVYYTFESVLFGDCSQTWNLPFMVLETDFSNRASGQLSTRIEAFLETVEGAKSASRGTG